jgi:molybdate transport system substrate-binding protein
MERRMKRFACAVLTLLALAGATAAQDKTLTVFAAASLKTALDEVNAAYAQRSGVRITVSYAASSALIRQIEQGAPADVFASADLDWIDYGIAKGPINGATRVNLLGNRLVLIAPKDSKLTEVAIGPDFNLAALAGDGRIATGDVKAVPAGKYAKAALDKLGAWDAAQRRFAMTDNVRAALLLVARGEAALGIVYATDAKVEPGVKVIGTFPADSHPAIVYPFAATKIARPDAAGYLAFLRSGAARQTFERHGFSFIAPPGS